jgi:hypothetical protein
VPEEQVDELVHNPSALIEPAARSHLPGPLLRSISSALEDSLSNVFITGGVISALALLAGFRLPVDWSDTAATEGAKPQESSYGPAECERLLMAEMTTIDAEHEPEPREAL